MTTIHDINSKLNSTVVCDVNNWTINHPIDGTVNTTTTSICRSRHNLGMETGQNCRGHVLFSKSRMMTSSPPNDSDCRSVCVCVCVCACIYVFVCVSVFVRLWSSQKVSRQYRALSRASKTYTVLFQICIKFELSQIASSGAATVVVQWRKQWCCVVQCCSVG